MNFANGTKRPAAFVIWQVGEEAMHESKQTYNLLTFLKEL